MANTDAWEVFQMLAPDDYVNEACARIGIRMDKYRPVNHVSSINCPVLLQVGDHDHAVPEKAVKKAEKMMGPRIQVIHYPIDHFDVYRGDYLAKAVNDQAAFFRKHLI